MGFPPTGSNQTFVLEPNGKWEQKADIPIEVYDSAVVEFGNIDIGNVSIFQVLTQFFYVVVGRTE